MMNGLLDDLAESATILIRSGRARTPDEAAQMAISAYCRDGRCAGFGDLGDQVALDAVVADAQATQATHRLLIDNLATWPDQPVDDATRSRFSSELSQLEQDFTSRGLQSVGVQFPYQLDRTDPASAIILAVRDDIKETVALIDSGQMQAAVAKEVKAVQAPVTTALLDKASQMYEGAAKATTSLVQTGQKVVEDVGKAAAKAVENLPYIVGGVAVVALLVYFSNKKGSHAA